MFGYVKVERGELRVREYEYYRALYCGLCHRMGKCTGQCSRMSLNYDFVFLAAVRMALTGQRPKLERRRCFLHPLRPRLVVEGCEALDFCADASALLVYHKLADDIADERGVKKWRARLSRPFFKVGFKRAKRRHPALERAIADALAELAAEEREGVALVSADRPAAAFGALMQAVLCEGLEGAEERIAARIGRAVGHWIYLVDAADDFTEDRKKKRYNPYLRLFGDRLQESDVEGIRVALTALLCDAEEGILLLDGKDVAAELSEIISNVLYLGMPGTAKRVTQQMLCESGGQTQ